MPTRRGWTLLGAAVACGVTARTLGISPLWVVALAAAALLPLALLFAGWRHGLRSERVERLPTVAHGATIDATVHLANDGRMPIATREVADTIPAALGGRAHANLHGLPGGDRVRLSHQTVGTTRGLHQFGPLVVTVGDPMRLAEHKIALSGTTSVVVLPRVVELPATVRVASGLVPGDRGRGAPRSMGDDVGVLRDYVEGDDLRRIHWRATAHRGSLMVRQPESRQQRRVVVLLDRSDGPEFETRVSVAASIGAHHHERGIEVNVLDAAVGRASAPLPWPVQLERLALVQPEPGDIATIAAMLASGSAGGGTLVVVAPASTELVTLLQRLGRSFQRRLVVASATGRSAAAGRTALAAVAPMGWRGGVIVGLDQLPEAWEGIDRDRQRR